jgi:ADP-ribosyl-[dinitrogen reductase] hydrolase
MTTTPDFPISIEHRHKPSRPDVVRAMGTVVGAAVGDALGAPFEFAMAGEFGRRFAAPVIGGTGEMVGGGVFGWAPGEFTDDTQMAIALAEALLAHGGYDPDRVWEWFRTWVETARDVGTRTGASLAHADWRSVPKNTSHSAGNGALMRAFPLALAFGGADRETTRAVVLHQAALTHPDESAGWGAWIAVEMIRSAIRGGDALAEIDGLLDDMPDELSAQFAALLSPRWKPGDSAPSNGSVWGCLAEAVWAVRSTDSYEAAITAAIDLGGDTDTVACVVGAIAGAMYGMQAIPSRWATYVHGSLDTPAGRRSYSLFDLQNLARRLMGLAVKPDTPPETPAGPMEVAPSLHAADLLGAASVPTDWAVVSLCRTGDHFTAHPVRRNIYLIDEEGDHNLSIGDAVRDAVDAIDAFLAEGRNVVVHCHGGRSRTGLALKAWAMRAFGYDERAAHEWLEAAWHRYQDYNRDFLDFLHSEWTPQVG